MGAFDGMALLHVLRVFVGLHFPAAALKILMVFSDEQSAVMDIGSDALVSQGAGVADGTAPFKAVIGDSGGGHMQAAADGAGLTGGTDRFALSEFDLELHGSEELVMTRR